MKGPLAKEELGTLLLQATCAAKTIRAQRDRFLQFQLQLQLQPQLPGEGEGDAPARLRTEDVSSGILQASLLTRDCAKMLGVCLEIAARHGVPPSLPRALSPAVGDDELFDRLLALRLPRRPVTQAHAFARIEATLYAMYAVMRNIYGCVEHLSYIVDPTPADTDGHPLDTVGTATEPQEDIRKTRLPDTVAAATEHLAKIGLSAPAAAATEPTKDSSKIGLPDPAPAFSATGEPLPQETSNSMDLDLARTYLDRSCTLASIAVKHVGLAVTAISSCIDPKEVASISAYADSVAIV